MRVVPGDRQIDRGDQVLAGAVVVHAIADGQALRALGDQRHDRPGGRRLRLARPAEGREQDAVDRRRLVGAGVPTVSPAAPPGACQHAMCRHRAHARIVHLTHVPTGLSRPRGRQAIEQNRATTRQFRSNARAGRLVTRWRHELQRTHRRSPRRRRRCSSRAAPPATASRPHATSMRGWNVVATMRTPREDVLPRVRSPSGARARRDQARIHRGRGRGERADRRARQQCGHRRHRRLRGHADRHGARDLRDQHLRRDGDDPGRAAPVPRAALGRRGQRDLQRDPGPMPLVAVYAASKTAIEGFTASLALELEDFDVRRQAGRARLWADDELHEQRADAHGRADPRALRRLRRTRHGRLRAAAAVTHESDVAEAIWRARRTTTRASCASPPARTPSHSPNTAEAPARSVDVQAHVEVTRAVRVGRSS